MIARRHRKRKHHSVELNITPFMNVLVVLVSFLLATAVFSHVSKLDMNLPGGGASPDGSTPPPLQLEVTIRPDQLEVGDRVGGLMNEIPRKAGKHDFDALTQYLRQVKERFPDIVEATVLAEENTSYEDIVHVMDATRVDLHKDSSNSWVKFELFPQVALGSATVDPRGPQATASDSASGANP